MTWKRNKEAKRKSKLPYPNAKEDRTCPDGKIETWFCHNKFACQVYGKGKWYCETVRQKGKCPHMKGEKE